MPIIAKFAGTCRKCNRPIKVGDKIEWEKGKGSRHVTCPTAEPEPENVIRLSGGEGYGCRGWTPGQVVRNSARRIESGEPEFLYIISSKSRYIREDGMSFGVGDDWGHIYSAVCRPATNRESEPLRAKLAAAEAQRGAIAELDAIARDILERGTHPAGTENVPDGERMSDTQDIYGGGDWFVVGPAYIWYVRNNGYDGNDWSHSNVRTSGAGAIGWRVPFDAVLAEKIRSAAAIANRQPHN